MFRFVPAISKVTPRRRAPALLGLLLLAAFQVSVATHQLQHVGDHGFSDCQICSSVNQLDDAPLPHTQQLNISAAQQDAVSTDLHAFTPAAVIAAYHSRAPPHS